MHKPLLSLGLFGVFWAAAFWTLIELDGGAPEPAPISADPAARSQAPNPIKPTTQAARLPPSTPVDAPRARAPAPWRAAASPPEPPLPEDEIAAESPERPDAFPLSESEWRDAEPEEAWLEPFDDAPPLTTDAEPFDDPWGGAWTDQGGGA